MPPAGRAVWGARRAPGSGLAYLGVYAALCRGSAPGRQQASLTVLPRSSSACLALPCRIASPHKVASAVYCFKTPWRC